MLNHISIQKKTRTFTLALVDNDDTLIDKEAKINFDLLKHLKEQVRPDYLAIITGRTIGTVPSKNLNPSSLSYSDDWKKQLAFDDVYESLINLQDSENHNLKIDFVSTPYDLAHVEEDDWQGFYQKKMKPFEEELKSISTNITDANKNWNDRAKSETGISEEEENCDVITIDINLSKQKYQEIVKAFKANDDVKNKLIASHPSADALPNKYLQTLDFLRKLAQRKSLTETFDELEIAIYDDSQDNIDAMKKAIEDFKKLTGLNVKIFEARIKYGENADIFTQTNEVCAKLSADLVYHRRFYDELPKYRDEANNTELFYRLKNTYKDQISTSYQQDADGSGLALTTYSQHLSFQSPAIDETRYDFKLTTSQEPNPILQAIINNDQQDYFNELAKIILATKDKFDLDKSEDEKLDVDNITKIITMAIALKGFTEKSDEYLTKYWQAIEGNPNLSARDLRRFGAIFQKEISKYALTGNPSATTMVGMRLKRININFLPEIMEQAQIQLKKTDQPSDIKDSIKDNLQKLSELNITGALRDQSINDQAKNEFYNQLLIPKSSPLRPSALSVIPISRRITYC